MHATIIGGRRIGSIWVLNKTQFEKQSRACCNVNLGENNANPLKCRTSFMAVNRVDKRFSKQDESLLS